MNLILLSGGSGKRLWPISNDVRSKQFIKIFRTENGSHESMVQRVYRQIQSANPDTSVTIATSKTQASVILNQLGDKVSICVEPCRRDTFPAIALSAAFLHDVKGMHDDEVVVVCPVDPYVNGDYFEALNELALLAGTGKHNLVLMGMAPSYPSEKYGYILPQDDYRLSSVKAFKEKPDAAAAAAYIRQGALWNGGVFAFRLKYVLQKAAQLLGCSDHASLYANYAALKKVSFDYAVVEKEPSIQVMRFDGRWVDIGTWNTLTEAMEESSIGDVRLDSSCHNVHVINELNMPILCMGLQNLVVSASPEGILVSDKAQSSYIKPFVDKIDQQIMFAEKSWGSFRVLDVNRGSLIIKVTLQPGHRMHYHSHLLRSEVWTVVSGTGRAVVDSNIRCIVPGDVVCLPAGRRHTVFADTELQIIEVQIGEGIHVDDKVKHMDDFDGLK